MSEIMANPLDITVEQANAIVLAAARGKGWARPELSHSQDPDTQELLETLRLTRESLGDVVDIIARGIYSTRGRFILELIQNVEDSDFNHADLQPYVSFELNPQSIVVESNQDGFSAADVAQICHTGNSWKRGRSGYVGEKGIGFKSVFKVASKVDVQSNAFSFSFQYNGGPSAEEKLGMITPIAGANPIAPEERPLTRMSLTKNNATPYLDIISDFQSIPESLLLFLRKLREIRIKIHFLDVRGTSLKIFRIVSSLEGPTRITRIDIPNRGNPHTREWRYHVIRAPIVGLPDDTAREGINECEGVVAFPIGIDGTPRLQAGPDVYAFLPVRRAGFNFIIQADFLLEASRQELTVDSDWNKSIIDQIAQVFCRTIETFTTNPMLSHLWMRFLPLGRQFELNPLWKKLSESIINHLKEVRILFCHRVEVQDRMGNMRRPGDLRTLPENALDDFGSPLFADLPGSDRKYLSTQYTAPDIIILRSAFDILEISDHSIIDRVEQDLESPASVMKCPNTTAEWHTRAAELIKVIWDRSPDLRRDIKGNLQLIPLTDGRWVSASMGNLFFASPTGPNIPFDLVKTVESSSSRNASRRSLFEKLGIDDIQPATVIDRLWSLYSRNTDYITIETSKSHLQYLYWHSRDIRDARISRIWTFTTTLRRITSLHGLVYFPFDDEYGPRELLKAVTRRDEPHRLTPVCSVSYLDVEYLDAFPEYTFRNGVSWHDWLETALGVRRRIRLKANAGSLSQEFRHILAYRPEKIVGLLKRHWRTYRTENLTNGNIDDVSRSQVLCRNGTLAPLSSTYFPLQTLTERALGIQLPQTFPFLTGPNIGEEDRTFEDWRFLSTFGVRFEADVRFYLDGLVHHTSHAHANWDNATRDGIVRAYELIADQCNEISRAMVVNEFIQNRLILHPCSFLPTSTQATWLDPRDCVWRGPRTNLLRKTTLAFPKYRNNGRVTRLMCDILNIRNSDWEDYLTGLRDFRQSVNPPVGLLAKVKELYSLLSSQELDEETWAMLLDNFEREELIYIPSSGSWKAPSSCLLESPVAIPGKTNLDGEYTEELLAFFDLRMGVSPAVIGTLVQGLYTLANELPSLNAIKQMIVAINEMTPSREDLELLVGRRVLPLKNIPGDDVLRLRSSEDDFAIIDRNKLQIIFQDHIQMLDFSLEEVSQLQPFISALELENKYISRISKEQTRCDAGVVDSNLSEIFQQKAYNILRCAFSNRSPLVGGNPEQLYNRLASTSISKSSRISTRYTIQYESGVIVGPVLQNTGHIHIQEQDNGWLIFVPDNGMAREVCYLRHFPVALAKLFRINQSASENISQVLKCSLGAINEILEDGGVGQIAGFERPQRFDLGVSDDDYDINRRLMLNRDQHRGIGHNTPDSSDSDEDDVRRPNVYLELLDNVIRIAQNTTIPHRDAVIVPVNGLAHAGFNHNAAFGARSQGQMNHDVKVGAAGELFAYELLKSLIPPPLFGYANWTSTIRRLVLDHPNYQDMGRWPGHRETSDLHYDDTDSILTQTLIDGGYLEAEVWSGGTPEYFIEVKTTSHEVGERFFMSSNQFRLMQDMALVEGQTSDRVYLIFRVFNLGRESLGLKIYVDPEAHRGRDLAFAENSWTVTTM